MLENFYFYDKKNSFLYVSNNFIDLYQKCKIKDIYSVPRGGYLIIDKEKKVHEKHKISEANTQFKIDSVRTIFNDFFKFLKSKLKKNRLFVYQED